MSVTSTVVHGTQSLTYFLNYTNNLMQDYLCQAT